LSVLAALFSVGQGSCKCSSVAGGRENSQVDGEASGRQGSIMSWGAYLVVESFTRKR